MEIGPPFEGAEIHIRAVDDESKIASWTLGGAVICEAALCTEEAYEKLWARTVNRMDDSFLLLTGTFEKQEGPWYARKYRAWALQLRKDEMEFDRVIGRSFSVPSSANHVMYPGGDQDPKIVALRNGMSEDRFMERHAGIPVPPATLVFKKFGDRHIGDHPFRKHYPREDTEDKLVRWPVFLAIDPGYANYAILALQRQGEDIYVIDEVWGHNKTTEELIQICRNRPWFSNITPRNAGAIDIAGKQHHGDRSVVEVWRETQPVRAVKKKLNFQFRKKHVKIEDGIERLDTFLEDQGRKYAVNDDGIALWTKPEDWVRLHIDRRCVNLIEEFERFQYPDGEISGRRVPIDEYDHGLKALWYFLIAYYGRVRRVATKMEIRHTA
jgi:hypothetical protein